MKQSALWHPFSAMADVIGNEIVFDRAEGCWLFDETGRRYLDGTAALWYCQVGHGRTEIADAVATQLKRLDAFSIFGSYSNRPAMELAERLADLAPITNAKVFLASGGGDADDSAIKLARQFHSRRGEPQRTHVISRVGSYHGTHGIGTALAGIPANRDGFGDYMSDSSRIDMLSSEALERQILTLGADRVAAFIAEPVIGAGGVVAPPEGYLAQCAEICRRHGVLFIVDAVISGFGRLGTWYGIERWDVVPDMVAFAKGVTSGYLPLGGVVVSEEVAAPFWETGAAPFRHGPTYSGHPAVAVAALVNLEILEKEELLVRSRKQEIPLADTLRTMSSLEGVVEVRVGAGLIGAVAFTEDVLRAAPNAGVRVQEACLKEGVVVRGLGDSVAVSPPLTITDEQIRHLGDVLAAGMQTVVGNLS